MFVRKNTKQTIDWDERRSLIKESDLITLRLRILELKKSRLYDDSFSANASMIHFCQTEPLFKAVGLYDDAMSMKAFMNKVFEQMEKAISFCALEEGTNDLVGVLVASTFEKSQWLVKKEQGETLRQILLLRNYVVAKAQFYKVTNVDKFVCVDVLCVKPDHQNNGVGTALLRSCVARASYLAAACVGQFTSGAAQTIANRLDFKTLYQLPYEQLSKRKSRFEIFQACYPENYSIACMAVQLSPPEFQLPITFDSTPTKTQREDYGKRRKARRKE